MNYQGEKGVILLADHSFIIITVSELIVLLNIGIGEASVD